jgi:predicted amidohydrolase
MLEQPTTVLLAQLEPLTNDVISSAHVVGQLLAEHDEVDLAIFPELFLNGNSLNFVHESAVSVGSQAVRRMRDAARRTHTAVIVGVAERSFGFPSDAALCIDEAGEIAGIYRKVHLAEEEQRHLRPGSSFTVVPMAGLMVAPLMAEDLAYPEATRAVARAGIDLLVTIAASEDRDAEERAVFVRARAIENRLPHIYVNRVGEESGRRYGGESTIVDASGAPLITLVSARPDVRVAEVQIGSTVEPDYPRRTREEVGVLPPADRTMDRSPMGSVEPSEPDVPNGSFTPESSQPGERAEVAGGPRSAPRAG